MKLVDKCLSLVGLARKSVVNKRLKNHLEFAIALGEAAKEKGVPVVCEGNRLIDSNQGDTVFVLGDYVMVDGCNLESIWVIPGADHICINNCVFTPKDKNWAISTGE